MVGKESRGFVPVHRKASLNLDSLQELFVLHRQSFARIVTREDQLDTARYQVLVSQSLPAQDAHPIAVLLARAFLRVPDVPFSGRLCSDNQPISGGLPIIPQREGSRGAARCCQIFREPWPSGPFAGVTLFERIGLPPTD